MEGAGVRPRRRRSYPFRGECGCLDRGGRPPVRRFDPDGVVVRLDRPPAPNEAAGLTVALDTGGRGEKDENNTQEVACHSARTSPVVVVPRLDLRVVDSGVGRSLLPDRAAEARRICEHRNGHGKDGDRHPAAVDQRVRPCPSLRLRLRQSSKIAGATECLGWVQTRERFYHPGNYPVYRLVVGLDTR